ncbi:tetraspanin-14 isoform X4 [Myotis lucifugus]|uniref:tetraspanin-14 isoform X4 n=1 Tax=Myotis lucifugus TaxID=59463 RepID=UPI000CCC85DE|nr:tetraspanin-14 isoform X4 [Myotis lucifugus]
MERKGGAVRPHQSDPAAWNRPRGAGADGGRGHVHPGVCWLCGGPAGEHLPAQVFCGTIVLIFFLELAVAVLAFLFQDWVRDRFREFFESNIKSYRDDIDLQNLIDSLQKANQCCGAYGPEDWDLNVYFNCSGASYSREKCGVPFSCCVPDPAQKVLNTQCGYDVRTQLKSKWDEFIFTKGCIPALEGWLPRNIYIVAGVFIAISLLQIFGIFLAKTLISDIEAVKAGHHF